MSARTKGRTGAGRHSGPVLIQNGLIITQNANRDIISADILIEDGRIKKIAPNIGIKERIKRIDATGRVVMPGIMNSHLHSDAFLYKGLGDNLRLFEQFTDPLLNRIWDNETKEQLGTGALGNYCECIKNGITFVNDFPFSQFFVKELVAAMTTSKLRGAITSFDFTNETGIDNETFIDLCMDAGIIPILTVPAEENMDEERLVALQQYGSLLKHGHILECKERSDIIKKKFKKSTIDILNEHGLLDPQLHIVHGNQLTEQDVKKVGKSGARVIITPSAELKLNDGLFPVQKLLDNKVVVGLGTDGGIWNNSTDLFREMKTLLLVQKGVYGVKTLDAQDVLDMVTINAAKCFCIDDRVGSIEEGKEADLILIRTDSFTLSPIILAPKSNVISNIVYCATGNDVTHTMVRGKLLMEERRLLFIDEKDILKKIQTTANELMRKIEKKQ